MTAYKKDPYEDQTARWVNDALAVGNRLDVLCDCGVPEGKSEASHPRDRTIKLPHHFDCAAVLAWPVVAAARAEALKQAADEWQQRVWATGPRRKDRLTERIASAQFVANWLRERAFLETL